MPKSIVIEPDQVFAREVIRFADIPLNAYDQTVEEELAEYTKDALLDIWQDMCGIREFESALQEIKTKGPTRASPTCTRARRTCQSDRKLRPWAWHFRSSQTITSSGRIAATARSWPKASRRSGS